MTTFYCPCCGETTEIEPVSIVPGTTLMTCPCCGTEFVVSIEFAESDPQP
jgi:transposase